MPEPLLGPAQHFPMRCMECREWFSKGDYTVMIPYLVAGTGQLLFAVWLCNACAQTPGWRSLAARATDKTGRPVPIVEDEEPPEVRHARRSAELADARRAVATGRQSVSQRKLAKALARGEGWNR